MLFQGEKEAIATVLKLSKRYGYGNMIGWIRREWALDLIKQGVYSSDEYDEASEVTNSSPCPMDWDYKKME